MYRTAVGGTSPWGTQTTEAVEGKLQVLRHSAALKNESSPRQAADVQGGSHGLREPSQVTGIDILHIEEGTEITGSGCTSFGLLLGIHIKIAEEVAHPC